MFKDVNFEGLERTIFAMNNHLVKGLGVTWIIQKRIYVVLDCSCIFLLVKLIRLSFGSCKFRGHEPSLPGFIMRLCVLSCMLRLHVFALERI